MSFRLPVGNGSFCAIFKTDARADCDIYGSLSRRACSLANLAGRPSILIQYADRYTCAVYVNAHSEFGERFWLCAEALAIPCNQIKTYNNIDVVLQHKSRASHTFTYSWCALHHNRLRAAAQADLCVCASCHGFRLMHVWQFGIAPHIVTFRS